MATCKIDDCERTVDARGWCSRHYMRWRNYGDPLAGKAYRIVGDEVARFESYVERDGPTPTNRPELGACWVWTGTITSPRPGGPEYGLFSVGGAAGRTVRAHRYSYERDVGPIPEGLELDHLCRNTRCVNPSHLEPVTHLENVRRGRVGEVNRARELAKTHCIRGHPFDEANTHQTAKQRVCRACKRERHARYKAERKAAA